MEEKEKLWGAFHWCYQPHGPRGDWDEDSTWLHCSSGQAACGHCSCGWDSSRGAQQSPAQPWLLSEPPSVPSTRREKVEWEKALLITPNAALLSFKIFAGRKDAIFHFSSITLGGRLFKYYIFAISLLFLRSPSAHRRIQAVHSSCIDPNRHSLIAEMGMKTLLNSPWLMPLHQWRKRMEAPSACTHRCANGSDKQGDPVLEEPQWRLRLVGGQRCLRGFGLLEQSLISIAEKKRALTSA